MTDVKYPELPIAEVWVIPGDDNADMRGFLDAKAWTEDEFTKPFFTADQMRSYADDTCALRGADEARQFPDNTCPASRHAQMIGEALVKGEAFPQLSEEPEHCGQSILATVEALYRARTALRGAQKESGWRPISEAPAGELLVVGWLDPEDAENPERHHFDWLEDGAWQSHEDAREHFLMCAPPGSRGPKEAAPYTHFMRLGRIPAPTPEGEAK